MEAEKEHVLARASTSRAARSTGPRARSKGRAASAPASRSASASRSAGGKRRRSTRGSGARARDRSPAPARRPQRKAGAQNLVAPHDLPQAALQGGGVETPGQAHGERHVVGREPGLELVEDPEPLLGEGEGYRRPRRRGREDRRRRLSAPARRACSTSPASPATVGVSKRRRSGISTPKASRTPGGKPGGQQRVAAESEEVVVDAATLARRAPRARGRPAAPPGCGAARSAAAPAVGPARLRQRPAVHLAVGGERQAARKTKAAGTIEVGQPGLEAVPQVRRRRLPGAGTTQATSRRSRRPPRAHIDAASRTRRVAPRGRPRSPPAPRGSRGS